MASPQKKRPLNEAEMSDDSMSVITLFKAKLSDKCGNNFYAFSGELKEYIEQGPEVVLMAKDGEVTCKQRLLASRSSVLDRLLRSLRTSTIVTSAVDFKEVDSRAANAFVHFLMTGDIKDPTETSFGLISLAQKYHIPFLKVQAEEFIKSEILQTTTFRKYLDVQFQYNPESVESFYRCFCSSRDAESDSESE